MTTRRSTGVYVCAGALLVIGCSGSAAPETDPVGEVGSHVWFSSSAQIEVRSESYFEPALGGKGGSSSCWTLARDAMTSAQRAALEGIVLEPLRLQCTADGFQYSELTVVDANGSRTSYRDTGCEYLAVPGAKAMLAGDWRAGLDLGTPMECEL